MAALETKTKPEDEKIGKKVVPATLTTAFKARDSGVVSCPPSTEVPQLHMYFCLQMNIPPTLCRVTWMPSVSQGFTYHLQLLCAVQEP